MANDAVARRAGDGRADARTVLRRSLRPRMPRIRGVLATSAAVAAGVVGAALAAGGSYAYINATVDIDSGGTVTAGTAELLISYDSSTPAANVTIPASVFSTMLPGDVRGVPVTVTNAGDVTLDVSARLSTGTSPWEMRVVQGACPTGVIAGAPLTTTASPSVPVPPSVTQTVCLQVTLPSSAPAASENTSHSWNLVFDGSQVSS